MRMISSTVPSPWPPCSSPMKMPGQPSSQSSFQAASSYSPASASSRTRSILKRSASSSLAVRLIACWSSEKSKFTFAASLSQLRQAEHALGDDVLEDLRGAALDRIGAGAEEAIGPGRLPGGAVLAQHVDRELSKRLVDLGPLPLGERALWSRHPALHDLSEPAPGIQPQQLDLDRELAEPLPHHRVVRHAALLGELPELVQGDPHPHRRRCAEPGALVHE